MKLVHGALAMGMFVMRGMASAQGHAHQHGALTLDIGIEASSITMQISSPLDNLVGFEHAPRNNGERKRVDAALAKLAAEQQPIAIDPAAQCRLAKVEITSAMLGLGVPSTTNLEDRHGDLGATLIFQCQDASRATYVDVRLFDAFSGLKRIDVQVAGPRGQLMRQLRRPERRVILTR